MAGYNRTRYVEQLLEKTEDALPSFTVHLHAEYWILNHGSKFLYHNPIASLLDDIRAHRIPVDFLEFFDSARVPFYEGCMIVELLDYRPQRSSEPALKNPSKTRVVLHPSPETLWADICSLNQHTGGKWTDMDALEVESKLLLATSQPLCLDPDPHLTRVVNNVLRVSTPSMPLSLKRKASAMEPEEDGPEKARRERLLGFMAPRDNRAHAPRYYCFLYFSMIFTCSKP
ncbi:Spt20 family-domain-containing protein [Crepidotus variabilis]|uniref:Spt20 family-domain-containing protein n=1 Tax=Crepidotus variabilis TaxID=179855 RepID=A0A9P6E6D7_9AGAR|nr:Spt20 family-domain-containing protein [Crepidotus variabilis]